MSQNGGASLQRETQPIGAVFTVTLSALMAMTSLSVDIYLPAMPVMARALHGDVELTITAFLIGFAIAQLIWGPVSDAVGRRIPLIIGMILFSLGSIGCALSHSIGQIIFWRVFQAIGACTGPMLARAIVRDLFSGVKAAQMLSTLMIITAVAPILGPFIGGGIIKFLPWTVIFWFLSVAGLALLAAVYFLPETLRRERRAGFAPRVILGNYGALLRNGHFVRYVLCVATYYVSIYAFVAGSAFVYISYYGVSPQAYGWLFMINILGVTVMSAVNRRLVQRFSLDTLLKAATLIAVIGAFACLAVVRLQLAGLPAGGLAAYVLGLLLFFSMNGIIAAASTAAALEKAPHVAGSASALIGSLQYGSGIISSLLLALWGSATPWPMTVIIAVFGALSCLIIWTKRSGE